MPLFVFVEHGGAQFFHVARRCGLAEERLESERRERLVAGVAEVHAVNRERLPARRRVFVELLRRREEIDELHVVRLRHLGHRGGVVLQVRVRRRRVGEVCVLMLLIRDG